MPLALKEGLLKRQSSGRVYIRSLAPGAEEGE